MFIWLLKGDNFQTKSEMVFKLYVDEVKFFKGKAVAPGSTSMYKGR